jgi:hypothetical protein
MDREKYFLPGIIILVVIIILIIAVAFSENNTFNMGTISFEYPNGWSQEQVIGNFSNTALFSSTTLTSNFADSNGQSQPSYIIIEKQQKAVGTINLPTTDTIPMNTTNSTSASVSVDNITATQIGNIGTNMASKYTIIDKNNYYYILTYISPVYAVNQTQTAYNTILSSLNLS